jgi:hypothetical protein
MDIPASAHKRAYAACTEANDALPEQDPAKRRRTAGEGGAALPEGPIMSVPADVLDQIIGWLDERHLSCLLRASRPLYSAARRVLLAVPASYFEGRLLRPAKIQRVRTGVALLERQMLDWKDCLEIRRGVYRKPPESRGLICDYARGLGERYRHVCVYLDQPGLCDIAVGLAGSTGWRHLEVRACGSASRHLAVFINVLVTGLQGLASPERREITLHMSAELAPTLLDAIAASMLGLVAEDARCVVSGVRINAAMMEALALPIQSNPHLRHLAVDFQGGLQTGEGLDMLERCNVGLAGLSMQNLPAAMDYQRLAVVLNARPAIRSLSLYGRPVCMGASALELASCLGPGSLAKLGLYQLRLGAANLAGLGPALAAQAGLHTLKFQGCPFPDGIGPLVQGLAGNRSIVRMELTDCDIGGDPKDGSLQNAVLQALRHSPAIREIKIDGPDLPAFRQQVAELGRHCPGLRVIRHDAGRGASGHIIDDAQ